MGLAKIYYRIDGAFGNQDWNMQWGHVATNYELPHFLDHSSMMLTIRDIQ